MLRLLCLLCLLCAVASAEAGAADNDESPQQAVDQTETQLRQRLWAVYDMTGPLGPDERGRTPSQDLREWVMTSADSAQLLQLRASAAHDAAAGRSSAVSEALGKAHTLLDEQGRRLTIISTYWSHRVDLERERSLWSSWLAQVPEPDAALSRARVQTALADWQAAFSPAMTWEALTARLHALDGSYNDERLKLAMRVGEQRAAAGEVMSSRERSVPCPEPSKDKSAAGDASHGGVKPIHMLSSPSISDYYPARARRSGSTGKVILRLDIDASGCLQRTAVTRSTGDPDLDEAAIDFAEHARFSPAEKDGVAVLSRVNLPVAFTLDGLSAASAEDFVQSGMKLAASGDNSAAIAAFSRALALDPRSDAALSNRGMMYLRQRSTDQARADFDAAEAINPNNALVFAGRGYLAASTDPSGALAQFSRSLELEPGSREALFGRAHAYEHLGQLDNANADVAEMIRLHPNDLQSYLLRGEVLLDSGSFDLSIADLTKVLEMAPRYGIALAERGMDYVWKGNYDLARSDLDAAFSLDPNNPVVARARGLMAARTHHYTEAIDEFTRSLELDPGNPFALRWRASSRSKLGQREQALHDISIILQVFPDADWAYLDRVEYRLPTDQSGKRSDVYAALRLNAHSASALRLLAQLPADAAQAMRDVTFADAALKFKPDDWAMLASRGILYWRSHQDRLAEQDLAAAKGIAPNAVAYNYLCWELGVAGFELPLALQECDAALARAPDSAPYLDSRGLVLLRLKRYDESITSYDAALKVREVGASSLYGRGLARRAAGDIARGDADIRAALAEDASIADQFAVYGLKP